MEKLMNSSVSSNEGRVSNFFRSLFDYRKNEKTVMIVEDDELLKPYLLKILYSIDPKMGVTWVKNVKEAKEELRMKTYCDLIISDCLLANGENGVELLNYRNQLNLNIPFIMISGLKLETINKYVGNVGDFKNFLQKPFKEQECRQIVLDSLH